MLDRIAHYKSLCAELSLSDTPQSYVGGAFVTGGGAKIALEDPFSRVILTEYPDCGAEIAKQACAASDAAQKVWMADFTAAGRGIVMQKIANIVDERHETLAQVEAVVSGKPIRDCRVEVAKVSEMFRYYAGYTDKLHGQVIPVPSGHLNYTVREPLGVIFQITPWNAPMFTAGWQVAPAIACGNGVVLKPSELTPVTSIALAAICEEAGAPKGLVNVLAGLGPTAGEAAIAHDATRKVVFVGSPATGRVVATSAGKALKPVVLELGGKSANIVFEDADLEAACKGAQAAIFATAGQSCVAGSRLLVQASIKDQFVKMVADGMQQLKVGDPLDKATEIGPISNRRQFDHVTAMIGQAAKDGASVLTGTSHEADALIVPPTILADLPPGSDAAQTEIFGPVVTVLSFEDEADAIRIANSTDFGLAGAVWTKNVSLAHRMAANVRAGTFWVNGYKAIHVSTPFGGSRSSGFGRSSGMDVLMEYTEPKSIWVETAQVPRVAFGYAPSE
ncbi:Acyl-CoA reductase [Epibacterium ulvae]|uniref:Acyl-CoA reductase n=1 Tax=Epibacterium ulvae TaxID=1156985 RepID=A0A1G5RK61_9RHOB|nr:aldehyde dehydrogenase family protein [Epibacterium ulvae]SCZ74258.1 Acyl-CoA reductase [Epibacterium ulvae]